MLGGILNHHIENSADVAASADIGENAHIWHLAQVREDARIGSGCNIGRGAYIGPEVVLGRNCKVQNYALVYEPARLDDGVFIGPAAVLTNDLFPRAVTPEGHLKTGDDWDAVGVEIGQGASVGARAVCIAPLTIGSWAMIAAGAVVSKNVPAHALMVGVPARRVGWVDKLGHRLIQQGDLWISPASSEEYIVVDDELVLQPSRESRSAQPDH